MSKIKVVLLDNNEKERGEVRTILETSGDYEVTLDCANGMKGVEHISSTHPDLIITDLLLESIDGYELIERVRKLDYRPKILVISSLKNDEFAIKAMEMGASYFMLKPVDKEVLLKRCQAILRGDLAERPSTQKVTHKRNLDERLSNIFITVGIPAHIKGYQFLREAVKMAIDEPEVINSITKQLYPSIASRFSTSASKVERAIRHAIEVAWNRGKIENINSVFGIKIYDSNDKPTNGEFIALVADKMLMEGA